MAEPLVDVLTADKTQVADRPQVGFDSFADRMEQVYGKEGFDKRVAIVNKRLSDGSRPQNLTDIGFSKFDSTKATDRFPTYFTNEMPEWIVAESEHPEGDWRRPNPKNWGDSYWGQYRTPESGGPAAYVYSGTNRKPDMFSQTPIPGGQFYGKAPHAYIPKSTDTLHHEISHHVYPREDPEWAKLRGPSARRDLPEFGTEAGKKARKKRLQATGDVMYGLQRGGTAEGEGAPYLSEVIRWYANRNLDPERLRNDKEYRLNAPRDIPETAEDHAKAWDAFGEMVKEKGQWGLFTPGKWDYLNRTKGRQGNMRQKILDILPEVVQSDDLSSNMIA